MTFETKKPSRFDPRTAPLPDAIDFEPDIKMFNAMVMGGNMWQVGAIARKVQRAMLLSMAAAASSATGQAFLYLYDMDASDKMYATRAVDRSMEIVVGAGGGQHQARIVHAGIKSDEAIRARDPTSDAVPDWDHLQEVVERHALLLHSETSMDITVLVDAYFEATCPGKMLCDRISKFSHVRNVIATTQERAQLR